MAAAPESASWPTAPVVVLAAALVSDHAFSLDDFAPFACVRASGPALARRRLGTSGRFDVHSGHG